MAKFKRGDVLILKQDAPLHVEYGWPRDMVIKIITVGVDNYKFIHLVGDPYWVNKTSLDGWLHYIVDESFIIGKAAQALYGGKSDY